VNIARSGAFLSTGFFYLLANNPESPKKKQDTFSMNISGNFG